MTAHTVVQADVSLIYALQVAGTLTFLKHVVTFVATMVGSLLNALRPGSQHSEGWRVDTVCVQVRRVPTFTVCVLSCQTPNKDRNEQLSPCLRRVTQLWMNVKHSFIG